MTWCDAQLTQGLDGGTGHLQHHSSSSLIHTEQMGYNVIFEGFSVYDGIIWRGGTVSPGRRHGVKDQNGCDSIIFMDNR